MPLPLAKAERLELPRARLIAAADRRISKKRPSPVFGGRSVRCTQNKLSLVHRSSEETATTAVKVVTTAAGSFATAFDITPVAVDTSVEDAAPAAESEVAPCATEWDDATAVRREYLRRLHDALERGLIKFESTPSSVWPDASPGHVVVVPGRNAHRASRRYIRNHRHWLKAAGFTFNGEKELWWRLAPEGWQGHVGA